MARLKRIDLFVAAVLVLAAAAVAFPAWTDTGTVPPGPWAVISFVVVAFLLDQTNTNLKVAAVGSTSFVLHMTAGILFGGAWGGAIAAMSTGLSQVTRGQAPVKTIFNVGQRALSISGAVLIYRLLGGSIPPSYLISGVTTPDFVQRDLILFFVFAAAYFLINSACVSGAISLSTGRKFSDVWNLNTRGVLGYDLGASVIAILMAWTFLAVEARYRMGALSLVLVVVPVVVVRHIYGMYRELQKNGEELLDLMVKAIEARDPYTSGHSVRVATLARAIAKELGLAVEEVEHISTAALLHDVGKIHEEFAPLLRKEAKLTPDERALLQTHAVKSAELVSIISSFRGRVQDAVRSHHERWDGAGYPDGLAGDKIPIGARIIMICDTIDAMTTDRPYRKALSLDAVIAELQRHRAAQFDPSLVDLTINSVAVRRAINELQPTNRQPADSFAAAGGSRRAAGLGPLLKGRSTGLQ